MKVMPCPPEKEEELRNGFWKALESLEEYEPNEMFSIVVMLLINILGSQPFTDEEIDEVGEYIKKSIKEIRQKILEAEEK